MSHMLLAAALPLGGCFMQAGLDGAATSRVPGGGFSLAMGDRTVRGTVEYLAVDTGSGKSLGYLGWGASASLLATVLHEPDSVTRWFDAGADLGIGLAAADALAPAPTNLAMWAGAWTELSLGSREHSYPTLHLELRREQSFKTVPSTTAFLVGLAWTWPRVEIIAR